MIDIGWARIVFVLQAAQERAEQVSAERELVRLSPRVPGLLIGRLGVDRRAARQGLGTVLVHYILRKAVEINAMAACRAVVVDALNPRELRWWQRFGFAPLDPDEASNLDLYLLTGDIERTLAEASDGPS